MEKEMKVYSAIAAVAAGLAKEGVGKDRQNKEQGYSFRGIDAVMNALSPLLVANKLVITPRYSERSLSERTTAKGNKMFNVTVTATYTIACAEDNSSIEAGPFYGEGQDSGDKATNKAMSAAYKYMATQLFCIPFEGMDDGDAETPEQAVAERKAEPPRERTAEEIAVDTAQNLINAIKRADTPEAVDKIMHGSVKTLARLRENYNKPPLRLYDQVQGARADRLAALEPPFPQYDERDDEITP